MDMDISQLNIHVNFFQWTFFFYMIQTLLYANDAYGIWNEIEQQLAMKWKWMTKNVPIFMYECLKISSVPCGGFVKELTGKNFYSWISANIRWNFLKNSENSLEKSKFRPKFPQWPPKHSNDNEPSLSTIISISFCLIFIPSFYPSTHVYILNSAKNHVNIQ